MFRTLIVTFALAWTVAAEAESSGGRFRSILGFTLYKSTLSDVQKKLGIANEFAVSDGHHETAICYRFKNSPAVVIFSTDSEFGGPKKLLLGFTVRASNDKNFPCTSIAFAPNDAEVDGLRLGISESRCRALIGQPKPGVSGDMLRHTFESKRSLTPDEAKLLHGMPKITEMDDTHTVWGVIAKGRVSEYGAWLEQTF